MNRMMLLLVLLSYSINSNAAEASKITPYQYQIIDSCLNDLILAGKGADAKIQNRINSNITTIRANLPHHELRRKKGPEIDSVRLQALLEIVRKSFPFEQQLPYIKRISANSKFTMNQTQRIIQLIAFNKERREVASILLPRTIDLENLDELYDVLWSPDDKKFLQSFVDSMIQSENPPQ